MRTKRVENLTKVTCPKGHDITVADNFPVNYDALSCDVCRKIYPIKQPKIAVV